MKKPVKIIFVISTILLLSTCFSTRYKQLINLTTQESPTETKLILTLSKPVQFKDATLKDSSIIIINFPGGDVYSNEEDEVVINKGPIKKVKHGYSRKIGDNVRLLDFVLIELAQELPHRITRSGSSIIIAVENPERLSNMPHKDKEKKEGQPEPGSLSPLEQSGYLIGPLDVLNVEVWRHPDTSREVAVNYKGEITLPPLRQISLMGLTVPQVEEELAKALSKYLIDPIVFVTVKEFNSQRVIVLGETTPGMHTLKRRTTLVEFISEIGGLSDTGDTSKIKLIKKNGEVFTFNLESLLYDPQRRNEVLVEGGDTVYVPPLEQNKVYILGEVNNPTSVVVKGKITVMDALTEAGGYTRDAVIRSVIIVRGEVGSQRAIRVDLDRFLKKSDVGQNVALEPGDVVYVPKSFIASVEQFLRLMSTPILWTLWVR